MPSLLCKKTSSKGLGGVGDWGTGTCFEERKHEITGDDLLSSLSFPLSPTFSSRSESIFSRDQSYRL